ncbi:MAG: hypothetical protein ITG02_16020 [Patulibacter sp.]|nr:hypothetical protein [Patulibacter sp.]
MQQTLEDNRKLSAYLAGTAQDWPSGQLGDRAFVFDDHLETHLATHWTEFTVVKKTLIASGQCTDGKSAATYRLTAKTAANPCPQLVRIIETVKVLAQPSDFAR